MSAPQPCYFATPSVKQIANNPFCYTEETKSFNYNTTTELSLETISLLPNASRSLYIYVLFVNDEHIKTKIMYCWNLY